VAKRRTALGPDHPSVAGSQNNVGAVLDELGRRKEAKEELAAALRVYRTALGPDHPMTGDTLHNLGGLFVRGGNTEQGLAHWQAAAELYDRSLGPDSGAAALERAQIAALWTDMGRLAEAEQALRAALPRLEKAYGPDSSYVRVSRTNLGNALLEQDKLQEADDVYAQLVDRWKALHPKDELDPALAKVLVARSDIAEHRHQYQRAVALAREGLAVAERQNPPESVSARNALTVLGESLIKSGRASEGVPALERALRLAQQEPTEDGQSTDSTKALASTQMELAKGLWALGGSARRRRAVELVRASAAIWRSLGPGHRRGLAEAERWLTSHGGGRAQPGRS
jgi:tetratricopeptide (TPR) repeat protein